MKQNQLTAVIATASRHSEYSDCDITLPPWVAKREGALGRQVNLGEWSEDGCDLGQPRESEKE